MESRLLSEQSCVFHHADPYAVSAYVNHHVGQHHIGLSRTTHPQASLSHRKFAELDLCRLSYGGSVRVTSPALETLYHLQVLLSGNCLWRGPQREHHLLPGELLLINPDDPVDLTYSEDCEKFILKVPASLLDSVCDEQRWQRPSGGVRFCATTIGWTSWAGSSTCWAWSATRPRQAARCLGYRGTTARSWPASY